MSKNNKTIRIAAIIVSVVVMIIAFIGINEYKEFKSDYKSYMLSLHRLNESYILGDDIDVFSDDYANVIEIEKKYQGRMFNSAFKKIQEDNAEFVEEIEKKRQEEIRNNNIVKNQRSEIENNRTEVERSEHERLELERSETARLEKERLERERLEQERKEKERNEMERLIEERRAIQEEKELNGIRSDFLRREVKIVENKVNKGVMANHEFVDLGLSVKWATCNVGANSPHEYGDYFAWSEIETKNNYDKNNHIETDTVYNDVVCREWGGAWRTPTQAECMELVNKCRWEWTTENGVNGYKVTGLIGTSIFLPASGNYDGDVKYHEGNDGYYWSSTPHETMPGQAYGISFKSTKHRVTSYSKYLGKSVRPVMK